MAGQVWLHPTPPVEVSRNRKSDSSFLSLHCPWVSMDRGTLFGAHVHYMHHRENQMFCLVLGEDFVSYGGIVLWVSLWLIAIE
eukprot:scaffold211587_cov20-Tisochrysis_lutea.AAC.1